MTRISILCIALLTTIISNIANAEIEMFCEGPKAHYLFKEDPVQVFGRIITEYDVNIFCNIETTLCGMS